MKILGDYMVRICGSEIVEKISKFIRRDGHKKDICATNIRIEYNVRSQMSMKERIAKLIRENEKYFIYEIIRTTSDVIVHDNHYSIERLKSKGYAQGIAAEIFEKYGIFLYVTDLSSYVYAPKYVKYELYLLIEEYGLEKVTEEIAIYLKDNYPNMFGINTVAVQ